jgi:hypothetical protein
MGGGGDAGQTGGGPAFAPELPGAPPSLAQGGAEAASALDVVAAESAASFAEAMPAAENTLSDTAPAAALAAAEPAIKSQAEPAVTQIAASTPEPAATPEATATPEPTDTPRATAVAYAAPSTPAPTLAAQVDTLSQSEFALDSDPGWLRSAQWLLGGAVLLFGLLWAFSHRRR